MRELPGVLVSAARVLARHWPALLVLALLAAAVRSAAVWTAVAVSDTSGQLAQVLLLVAPMGYLVPFVGMLVICRQSLPGLRRLDRREAEPTATEQRPRRLVDIAVSVLVPFLAVYQAYGLLEQDIFRFRNSAAFEEFNAGFDIFEEVDVDYAGRLGILSLQVAVLVVVAAWIVRWAIGKAERATRIAGLAFVGAFVELYYTSQIAGQTIVFRTEGVEWLRDRVAARWIEDAYDEVLDVLGFLAGPFDAVVGAAQALLSTVDAVVVVPVAFLALAAVVLGHKVVDDDADEGGTQPRRRGLLRSLLADIRERFAPLVEGVRLLASAGLGPMLVFCLALLVVSRAPVLVSLGARHVTGPIEIDDFIVVTPFEAGLGLAVSLVLTAPLLAAAVDWLVVRRDDPAGTSGYQRSVSRASGRRSPARPTRPAPG